MKRVNVGTDIALLGAWDYSRSGPPFSQPEVKNLIKSLEKDCLQGHLFLIKTGADCGGAVDIYIDEEVPVKVKERTNEISQHFLISIPTGKLVVGGVEDYRCKIPKITAPDSVVTIPPGDYSLKCYVGKADNDYIEDDSELELEKLVGAKEIRYFDRVTNWGLLSGIIFSILLFFLLAFTAGLPIALVVTIIIFLLYFHVFEWLFKRNSRYQRLKKIIPPFRIKHERSIFVFELKKVVDADKTGLKGGFIEL